MLKKMHQTNEIKAYHEAIEAMFQSKRTYNYLPHDLAHSEWLVI